MSNYKSLSSIVDTVLKSFVSLIKFKRISIKNNVPSSLNNVNGNADIIILLLFYLIDFALKNISKQGLIEIGADDKEKELEVWVKDNSIGIPNELKRIIFERQYNQIQNKNLGLSIAKRIADIYGGKIWVESEIGRGNTFIFTIPNRDYI